MTPVESAVATALETAHRRDKPFSHYKYIAFMSYAFDDDQAWNDWVTDFSQEFYYALQPRVRGITLPQPHLGRLNGPIQGALDQELRRRIDDSFSMILFVHDGYLESEWCLQELKYFAELFGEEGFRSRLYIIAMSKNAMQRLTARSIWKELFPYEHQVWMDFFQREHPDRPISIHSPRARQRTSVIDTEFFDRFVELREDLAEKIKRDVEMERAMVSYPRVIPGTPRSGAEPRRDDLIRIYIEGNQDQHRYWKPLGDQIALTWDQVVALERPEPPLYLRPTGLPIGEIDQRPILDDASGVILAWARKTPESLAAQVNQVEPKLSGPRPAPGLIAYLMENPSDHPSSSSINNWPVARFLTRSDDSATVLSDDQPILARFLHDALRRKRG
jgi:hypothetical protein